jgi:drug/metabolite transporter (DMT)-like permease
MICARSQEKMTTTAIILVLISAVVHAGWNLLGKRNRADPLYFAIAAAAGFLAILPLLLFQRALVMQLPRLVWLILPATGLFQALYYIGLAGAYRRIDLSVAYPVARALPVLFVPFIAMLLRTGTAPSVSALAGIALVTAGLLVLPLERGRVRPGTPGNGTHGSGTPGSGTRSIRWVPYALLAGVGTTGYSLIDDAALSVYRAALPVRVSPLIPLLIYAGLQSLSTFAILLVYVLAAGGVIIGGGRPAGGPASRSVRSAATTGVAIVIAYSLVLGAYGFASNVGYVVAFRQVSLPLGTVLGVLVLGEKVGPLRLGATALIVAGLVLVGAGQA